MSDKFRKIPDLSQDSSRIWTRDSRKMFKVKKKKVCTGFREHETFLEETLLKLACIRYFQQPILAVWPKNVSHSRFLGFSPGGSSKKARFCTNFWLDPPVKTSKISSMKHFSVKRPKLAIGNSVQCSLT